MEYKELQNTLEAVLFAAGEPISAERISEALEVDKKTVDGICQRLADEYSYQRRGIRLVRIEGSYQLCSAPEYVESVRKTLSGRKPPKLSTPAMEVLAIIAYFQPTTRAYIDQVRGVDSSYSLSLLLERELIEEAGRLAVPGRPIQYRTTKNFLRIFGLRTLEELPDLAIASAEEGQMTMAMQARLSELQDRQEQQNDPPPGEETP